MSHDAMHWTAAAAPSEPVAVGAVVDYHGSLTAVHGEHVVIAVHGAAYTLADRNHPAVSVLRWVRRTSFTPTGETAEMCGCGHETGVCSVPLCGCTHHRI